MASNHDVLSTIHSVTGSQQNMSSSKPSSSRNEFDPPDLDPVTLKRNPKIELSKEDLVRLLSCLEGELEARDVVIAALKNDKVKHMLALARGGRLSCTDPLLALDRDGSCVSERTMDEAAVRSMTEAPMLALNRLIHAQRGAQLKMIQYIGQLENRHSQVVADMNQRQQLVGATSSPGHSPDVHSAGSPAEAAAEDVQQQCASLREQLTAETAARHKAESELAATSDKLQEHRDQQKNLILMMLAERNMLIGKHTDEKQRCEHLSRVLAEERARAENMAEGLEEESKKSLVMEAELERHMSNFINEKRHLKSALAKEDQRYQELLGEHEKLLRECERLRNQLSQAHQVAMFQASSASQRLGGGQATATMVAPPRSSVVSATVAGGGHHGTTLPSSMTASKLVTSGHPPHPPSTTNTATTTTRCSAVASGSSVPPPAAGIVPAKSSTRRPPGSSSSTHVSSAAASGGVSGVSGVTSGSVKPAAIMAAAVATNVLATAQISAPAFPDSSPTTRSGGGTASITRHTHGHGLSSAGQSRITTAAAARSAYHSSSSSSPSAAVSGGVLPPATQRKVPLGRGVPPPVPPNKPVVAAPLSRPPPPPPHATTVVAPPASAAMVRQTQVRGACVTTTSGAVSSSSSSSSAGVVGSFVGQVCTVAEAPPSPLSHCPPAVTSYQHAPGVASMVSPVTDSAELDSPPPLPLCSPPARATVLPPCDWLVGEGCVGEGGSQAPDNSRTSATVVCNVDNCVLNGVCMCVCRPSTCCDNVSCTDQPTPQSPPLLPAHSTTVCPSGARPVAISAVMTAVCDGDEEKLGSLLDLNPDLTEKSQEGDMVFHGAARDGPASCLRQLVLKWQAVYMTTDMIPLLLEENHSGESVLSLAVSRATDNHLRVLLDFCPQLRPLLVSAAASVRQVDVRQGDVRQVDVRHADGRQVDVDGARLLLHASPQCRQYICAITGCAAVDIACEVYVECVVYDSAASSVLPLARHHLGSLNVTSGSTWCSVRETARRMLVTHMNRLHLTAVDQLGDGSALCNGAGHNCTPTPGLTIHHSDSDSEDSVGVMYSHVLSHSRQQSGEYSDDITVSTANPYHQLLRLHRDSASSGRSLTLSPSLLVSCALSTLLSTDWLQQTAALLWQRGCVVVNIISADGCVVVNSNNNSNNSSNDAVVEPGQDSLQYCSLVSRALLILARAHSDTDTLRDVITVRSAGDVMTDPSAAAAAVSRRVDVLVVGACEVTSLAEFHSRLPDGSLTVLACVTKPPAASAAADSDCHTPHSITVLRLSAEQAPLAELPVRLLALWRPTRDDGRLAWLQDVWRRVTVVAQQTAVCLPLTVSWWLSVTRPAVTAADACGDLTHRQLCCWLQRLWTEQLVPAAAVSAAVTDARQLQQTLTQLQSAIVQQPSILCAADLKLLSSMLPLPVSTSRDVSKVSGKVTTTGGGSPAAQTGKHVAVGKKRRSAGSAATSTRRTAGVRALAAPLLRRLPVASANTASTTTAGNGAKTRLK